MAKKQFFCPVPDIEMFLVMKLWQTESRRAQSCLAESCELEYLRLFIAMPLNQELTLDVSLHHPDLQFLTYKQGMIRALPEGEKEREEGCRRLNSMFMKYSEISR